MFLQCECGQMLNDNAFPNNVQHLLLTTYAQERLQDSVDKEVIADKVVDMWPEHWEESGVINVWKCFVCNRLYLNVGNENEDIIVYKVEKKRPQ